MKKRTAYLIISALLFSITAIGQSVEITETSSSSRDTKISLQRSIKLDKDSKPEEVIISIKPNTLQIDIFISSSVSEGRLLIELYDPNNTRQGNFTLGTQLSSVKNEVVNGIFQKSLKEPQAGNWKIKISPTKASGEIRISKNVFE